MSTHESVKDYYGKQLQNSADLKTDACCDLSSMPPWLPPLLSNIHSEVLERYYGCGLVAPLKLEGCRILDLGCGTGRDVYALAQLVGANGEVIGVDMTDEQLQVAMKYQDHHNRVFGFANTRFLKGYIERLDELGLEPESFDVIVSNCVINLSTDKAAVLSGALKLLKPGGEFYFSDVYSDRRVPAEVAQDPVLYGECLGGALYWGDFMRLSKQAGFTDPRLVESRPLAIDDLRLLDLTRGIRFFSATYRLFKHECLEPECEDYGQAVIYQGGIAGAEQVFVLDTGHAIERGRVFAVCGNTWLMLKQTRFKEHFSFIGNFDVHYGVFEGCGGGLPYLQSSDTKEASCC